MLARYQVEREGVPGGGLQRQRFMRPGGSRQDTHTHESRPGCQPPRGHFNAAYIDVCILCVAILVGGMLPRAVER